MSKKIVYNLCLNAMGALLYAVAINGFLIANHLGEGGVTGLMTLGYYLFHIAPGLTNLLLNGCLLLLGWKLLSKQTVFYTVYTIALISLFLKITVTLKFNLQEPLIAALIGGALMGVAMAFIMKGEGTLAGSTILAKIVNKFFGIKTGSAMLCFDLMVAIPSFVVIGFENMLLTIIELYLSAVLLNQFLDNFVAKKQLMIVSDKTNLLAQHLSLITGTGVTLVKGKGYISQQEKELLYLVCEAKDLVKVMGAIKKVDEAAFVVVEDVKSAYGRDLLRIL